MFTLREFNIKPKKKPRDLKPTMSTKTVATQTHTEHHSGNSKSTTTRTNLILSSFLGALA